MIIIAIAISGCEGVDFPLGTSEHAPFDERLLGEWYVGDLNEEVDLYSIYRFNEREYLVQVNEGVDLDVLHNPPDQIDAAALSTPGVAGTITGLIMPQLMRAYLTEIGDVRFANVQCVPCDDQPYNFYRVIVDAEDRVLLARLDRRPAAAMSSSEELSAFVAANAADDAIYDEHLVLQRVPAH